MLYQGESSSSPEAFCHSAAVFKLFSQSNQCLLIIAQARLSLLWLQQAAFIRHSCTMLTSTLGVSVVANQQEISSFVPAAPPLRMCHSDNPQIRTWILLPDFLSESHLNIPALFTGFYCTPLVNSSEFYKIHPLLCLASSEQPQQHLWSALTMWTSCAFNTTYIFVAVCSCICDYKWISQKDWPRKGQLLRKWWFNSPGFASKSKSTQWYFVTSNCADSLMLRYQMMKRFWSFTASHRHQSTSKIPPLVRGLLFSLSLYVKTVGITCKIMLM